MKIHDRRRSARILGMLAATFGVMEMNDESRTRLVQLGKAQIDGMFARQDVGPASDDSDFLPLVEIVLTAFEKTQSDETLANEIWEYAFAIYDRMCKEAEPTSTTAENRELMQS